MELKEALEAVVNEAQGGFADYAKTYAKAALELGDSHNAVIISSESNSISSKSNSMFIGIAPEKTGKMMVGEEMRVQILYVLSNFSHWRGERAREVKKVLKEASK